MPKQIFIWSNLHRFERNHWPEVRKTHHSTLSIKLHSTNILWPTVFTSSEPCPWAFTKHETQSLPPDPFQDTNNLQSIQFLIFAGWLSYRFSCDFSFQRFSFGLCAVHSFHTTHVWCISKTLDLVGSLRSTFPEYCTKKFWQKRASSQTSLIYFIHSKFPTKHVNSTVFHVRFDCATMTCRSWNGRLNA